MKPDDDWRLTFRPLVDSVPVAVRVRQLLKYAWRVCRLHCVAVEGPAEEAGEARDHEVTT
jgi:hypothetical protein